MPIGRRFFFILLGVVLFGGAIFPGGVARAQATQSKPLYLFNEVPIRLPSTTSVAPGAVRCDDNEFLYFRTDENASDGLSRAPVAEISPTGFAAHSFTITDAPDFKLAPTAAGTDFAVSSGGAVYFLVRNTEPTGPKLYVVHFGADGRYVGTVKLSHYFLPRRFTILPGGGYFVLALARDPWVEFESSRSGKPAPYTQPIGAFYDSHGTLRREINLPDAAVSSSPVTTESSAAPDLVAADYNGTVYVAKSKPAASLYVITNSGADVNSVVISPPFPHASLEAIAPAAEGELAVEFTTGGAGATPGKWQELLSIVDPTSGQVLANYGASLETGGRLGCHTQNGFELLAQDGNGNLQVRFVTGNPPPPITGGQNRP